MTVLLAALAGAVGSFVHYSSTFRILGHLPANNTRWQVYGLQLCSDEACESHVDLTQALNCTENKECTSGMCTSYSEKFTGLSGKQNCFSEGNCITDVYTWPTTWRHDDARVFLGESAAVPFNCLSLDRGTDSGAPVPDSEDSTAWFEVSFPMTVGVAAVRLFQGSDPNSAILVKLAIRGEGGAFYLAGEAPARQCPTTAAADSCCEVSPGTLVLSHVHSALTFPQAQHTHGSLAHSLSHSPHSPPRKETAPPRPSQGRTWETCNHTTFLQVTTPAPPLPPPAPPPSPPAALPGGDEQTQAILGKEAEDDVDWAMVIPLIVLAILLIAALLFFLWLAYQRGWIFGDGAPPASKHGLGEPSNSNASTNSKPSKPRGGRQQEETAVRPSVSQARPPFKLVSPPAGPHAAEPGPSEPRW